MKITTEKTIVPYLRKVNIEDEEEREMFMSNYWWKLQKARLEYMAAKEGLVFDFDNAPGYDRDTFLYDFFDGYGIGDMSDRELYNELMGCFKEHQEANQKKEKCNG